MSTDAIRSPVQDVEQEGCDSAIEVSSGEDSGPEYPAAERLAALKAISIHVPSTWRTPSPSPVRGPPQAPSHPTMRDLSPDYTYDSGPAVRTTFLVPQTLIDTRGRTPYPRSLSPSTIDTGINSRASSFPCPTPEPLPVPSPDTTRINNLGSLSPDTGGSRPGSPVQLRHPYPQSEEAEAVPSHTGAAVGGGDPSADRDAGNWDADPPTTWDAYVCRTPPPPGFNVNWGNNYIPYHIKDAEGTMWPAKYTRRLYGDDPYVEGLRAGSPTVYRQRLVALANAEREHLPRYQAPDLAFFSVQYPYRQEVDAAILWEGDIGLEAEIRRYRGLEMLIRRKQAEIHIAEEELYGAMRERAGTVRRLEGADAFDRLCAANGNAMKAVVDGLLERGRST